MFRELFAFVKRNGLNNIVVHVLELYLGAILKLLPGVEGLYLRGMFYRMLFRKAGSDLLIFPGVHILFSNKVAAGKRVAIKTRTYIDGGGEIEIGDHVIIGPNCVISCRDHLFESLEVPMCYQPVKYGKITIGSDVWLGANVFVKRGVRIHDGCVIAAVTVITKDGPPFSIFAGVPGRMIGSRKSGEERQPC